MTIYPYDTNLYAGMDLYQYYIHDHNDKGLWLRPIILSPDPCIQETVFIASDCLNAAWIIWLIVNLKVRYLYVPKSNPNPIKPIYAI